MKNMIKVIKMIKRIGWVGWYVLGGRMGVGKGRSRPRGFWEMGEAEGRVGWERRGGGWGEEGRKEKRVWEGKGRGEEG